MAGPGAALAADDPAGKAGEEGSVGGVLAVSPNPGEKPMTQRALTDCQVRRSLDELPGDLPADDPAGKAGEEGSVGGVLAVSPNPGEKPMTQRALTVLMVVSGAVLVYFVVRTVRMRRRNRKTRRYGVLDTNIENMELTPLEQDDEDDDNTLFDANHPRR
ncbi:PREDICTED: membrane protein FAM174A [Myotis brandtii]|uniref:membrane protein FAM174A n=1 Tax=Myotis brandtii TaxID=109478 RepID=UPI0003BB7226|nr:PREDICTED: membrane protein FAM174A [Myotis brandtii]